MSRIAAVILAAGKGTRLKTELPKVLHRVCGRPMLAYVFDACRAAGVSTNIGVVGYKHDLVIDAFAEATDIVWVEQNPQQGTGHAVMVCQEALADRFDHVLVLCGDGPLVRRETLVDLLERHQSSGAAITLATSVLADPTGYGRIVRDHQEALVGIVEHNDCTPEQRAIREINPSVYCFRVPELLAALAQLQPNPKKNEYYITDCVGWAIAQGHLVEAITAVASEDILSINTRHDLALVNRVMRDRVATRWLESGVTLVDPNNVWIDDRASIGADTIIHPFVTIDGPVTVGDNCEIGPFAHLSGNTTIPPGSRVAPLQQATIGGGAA